MQAKDLFTPATRSNRISVTERDLRDIKTPQEARVLQIYSTSHCWQGARCAVVISFPRSSSWDSRRHSRHDSHFGHRIWSSDVQVQKIQGTLSEIHPKDLSSLSLYLASGARDLLISGMPCFHYLKPVSRSTPRRLNTCTPTASRHFSMIPRVMRNAVLAVTSCTRLAVSRPIWLLPLYILATIIICSIYELGCRYTDRW